MMLVRRLLLTLALAACTAAPQKAADSAEPDAATATRHDSGPTLPTGVTTTGTTPTPTDTASTDTAPSPSDTGDTASTTQPDPRRWAGETLLVDDHDRLIPLLEEHA
ncbi:MAG: hypothetical protein ACI8PZ_006955, partial [Myxococcota bacterium]